MVTGADGSSLADFDFNRRIQFDWFGTCHGFFFSFFEPTTALFVVRSATCVASLTNFSRSSKPLTKQQINIKI